MPALVKTNLFLAKKSLKERRGRTFLTCLGIAIGVACVILILSLMGSINRLLETEMTNGDGRSLIVVRPGANENSSVSTILNDLTYSNKYSKSSLTLEDVKVIETLGFEQVAPVALSVNTLTSSDRTVPSATIVASTPTIDDLTNIALSDGTFIQENAKKAAIIGPELSLKLFGTTESIGKTFSMLGERFLIVGILERTNSPVNFVGVDFNESVIVNINTLASLEDSPKIQQIVINPSAVKTEDLKNIPTADLAEKIKTTLSKSKGGDLNFSVVYGKDVYNANNSTFTLISGMLTIVACVSLLGGGISVMNIMLVSVAERTHEIGIRKAVGATNLNIFLQFLFESLILSFAGGFMGLLIGYAFAFLISTMTPFTIFFSPEICLAALYISIVIGVIFGIFPAIKACRKPPIESLKYSN